MKLTREQKLRLLEAAMRLEPELRRMQREEMARGEFTPELSHAIEILDLYREEGIDAFT